MSAGLTAPPALAHVGVSSPNATQGGFGVLTFRMPNETAKADATELKVQLPADQPLASVSVQPQPGWTYTVTRAKLATPLTDDDGNQVTDCPSIVDWKATAGGIRPGEFAEFQLSVGPLPTAAAMTFKALQSDSDGSVVSWIEVPAAGSAAEPEHPAPTLKLTTAGATTATPAVTTTTTATTATADNAASKGSVTGAYVVGGIGLLAGLAALGLALTGRKRRTAAPESRESVSV